MTYSSNTVYSVYPTCLTGFGSEFPTSKWWKSSYQYTPTTTFFFSCSPTLIRPQS